jgi:hypothetical protein
MKRIYLLFVLLAAFAANSFAQADIKLTHNVPTGTKLCSGCNEAYIFIYSFKNLGPNALSATDKIVLRRHYGGGQALSLTLPGTSTNPPWPGGLPKDSTVYFRDTVVLTTSAASGDNIPVNWCDSAWAVTSANAVIPDPVVANNDTCNSVLVTRWATNINDVTVSNSMEVYPNPATNNLNIKYNFAANTAANVVIRDVIGKTVYTQNLGKNLAGEKEFTFDISALAPGLYMVELNTNDNKLVSKLNVQ